MPHSTPPKVTVFIPVYNRELYIGDAIRSILEQRFQGFEILLVDDGSTDKSLDVIRSFKDPRITVACNEKNLGIPRTRNRGLELAKGEFIALLDSDDRAHPDRLHKQVAFLDDHPQYAQVGSWVQLMDRQGIALKRIKRQPVTPEEIKGELLFRCCLSNRTIMGRTQILKQFGYRNDFPRCQDYDLHVRLSTQFKMGNIPECLVFGRIHPQQITALTPDLGDSKKCEIISFQLENLGVEYSAADLTPHLTLSRMRKLKFVPKAAYLRWAETWLLQLLRANQVTQVYSPDAFVKIIQKKWAHTCVRAIKGLGVAGFIKLISSPLSRAIFVGKP